MLGGADNPNGELPSYITGAFFLAMNGVGCRATARIMGVGLNTILRHLKNSGWRRWGVL
ncbi:IS1 ORF1 [Shigella sonnei]|nr:IS1 ORF1 [Shigella sonnei]